MNCPKCSFNNREDASFCKKCGSGLKLLCPSCETPYQKDSNFCNKCGRNLRPELHLKKSGSKILSERRNVTVLFSDLSGYTRLSEKLDPEEVKEITHRLFSEIVPIVDKYDGFIERVFGDEVLVYFGVPRSYEDHPVRAILAAKEIHDCVESLSFELRRRLGQPLRMHTGINTGLVVTGTTDASKAQDGFAGQTINIASRLTDLAEDGEILVGQETFRRTKPYFIFERLQPTTINAKDESIPIYRVVAVRDRKTRFDVSLEHDLTPFIDRERELELLRDSFKQVQAGRNLAVSITSRAGEGKSRLLYEFKKAVEATNAVLLESSCISYHTTTAYFPIIEILKSNFDIQDNDRKSEIKKKIRSGLKATELDEFSTIPYIYQLFSITDNRPQQKPPNPEHMKDQIIGLFRQIIAKRTKTQPLIIAIEDLHWIDKSSEELLGDLLKDLPAATTMFLFTYRTEYMPPWDDSSFCCQITLNPMTNMDSLAMVAYILGSEKLDVELQNLILEKTRGVPFSIEEFTKSLMDRKDIRKKGQTYYLVKHLHTLHIPSTIQDMIMARLDFLSEGAKDLLQKAAVVGLEFSHDVIRPLSGLSAEDLRKRLSILVASQLLYEKKLDLQPRYIFRHSLIQEVAYDSMLISKRKQVHEKVGTIIERLYQSNIDQFYELLAHHYFSSDNREKAYQYLVLAGHKAAERYSNWEAFHFFKSAADLIDEMPAGNDRIRKKIKALGLTSIPMVRLGYPEDSLRLITEGASLSKEINDEISLAKFYDLIGNYYSAKGGDPLLGIQYSEKCLVLAEKIGDLEIITKVARGLCGSYLVAGEPLKSVNLARKVIDLLENSGDHHGHPAGESTIIPVIYALYGHSQGWLGNFREGKPSAEKAIFLARRSTNFYDLAYIHFLCGYLYMHISDGKAVITHFEKCLRYCEEGKVIIWLGLGFTGLGIGYFFSGDLKRARQYAQKGIKIQEESQIPYYMSFHLLALGLISYDLENLNRARRYFSDALKLSEKYSEKWVEGVSKVYLGSIRGKTDRYPFEKLETSILEGIRILLARKIDPWVSVGYYILGKFYADNHIPEKAFKELKNAERMFKKMRMDFWLCRVQKALQRL